MSIQDVRNLHRAVNGPYDDWACEHCSKIAFAAATATDPKAITDERLYVDYPCETIYALDDILKRDAEPKGSYWVDGYWFDTEEVK